MPPRQISIYPRNKAHHQPSPNPPTMSLLALHHTSASYFPRFPGSIFTYTYTYRRRPSLSKLTRSACNPVRAGSRSATVTERAQVGCFAYMSLWLFAPVDVADKAHCVPLPDRAARRWKRVLGTCRHCVGPRVLFVYNCVIGTRLMGYRDARDRDWALVGEMIGKCC